MVYELTANFIKDYKKCDLSIKRKVDDRLSLFIKNHLDPALRNHALNGTYLGYRSINITGDWRALYMVKDAKSDNRIATFELLGTHSQLYK